MSEQKPVLDIITILSHPGLAEALLKSMAGKGAEPEDCPQEDFFNAPMYRLFSSLLGRQVVERWLSFVDFHPMEYDGIDDQAVVFLGFCSERNPLKIQQLLSKVYDRALTEVAIIMVAGQVRPCLTLPAFRRKQGLDKIVELFKQLHVINQALWATEREPWSLP